MNKLRKVSVLAAFGAALIAMPAPAWSVPLSSLFQGQTITADDKLFTNWTLVDQQVNSGVLDTSLIDVTPIVDNPLNPGVKFTAPIDAIGTLFGHNGGAFVRLRFSFQVQTTNQLPLIKDNSLLVNGWIFDAGPNATITISETVRNVLGGVIGAKEVVARNGDTPNTGNPNHFDTATFSPTSTVLVEKFIEILGPGVNDGARLTSFEQRFSQVPEPSGVVLALLLAVGAAAARRHGMR